MTAPMTCPIQLHCAPRRRPSFSSIAMATHLVQLGVADIALGIHMVNGGQQLAQAAGRRTRPGRDRLGRLLDPAHQQAGDGLVDRLLRLEEAIDIRRAHPQHLGDVGDGGLLIADFANRRFGHHEDAFPHVGFDSSETNVIASLNPALPQCSIIPPRRQAKCGFGFGLMLRRKIDVFASAGFPRLLRNQRA